MNAVYVVKCPKLGPVAFFVLPGDAEEWKTFYETKYPDMTGMTIQAEKWSPCND